VIADVATQWLIAPAQRSVQHSDCFVRLAWL
jgi:hypothetical protein